MARRWKKLLDELLDADTLYNPAFWMLAAGAEFALLLGYKAQSLWGIGTMPFYTLIITMLLVPVAAYFITMKMGS